MPFTVNVGPYQGGNYLFQGLSNLGQGIGGGIASATELRRKQQEEQGQSDTIFEEYLKSQKFSDDAAANKEMAAKEALKFHDLSPEGKKGVAAGIIQNWLQKYHGEQIKNMQSEAAAREQLAPAQVANLQSETALREAQMKAMQNTTPFVPSDVPGFTFARTPKGGEYLKTGDTKDDTPEQLNKDIRAATGHDIGDWLNAGNRREEGDLVVADILKPVIPGFGNPVQQTMKMPKSQYGAFVQRWKNLQTKAAIASGGAAAVLAPNASAGAGTAAGVVPDIVQPPPAPTPTPAATPAPEPLPERFMRAIVRNQPLPTATPLDSIADQISKAKPGVKPTPKATPAPAMSTRDQAVAILQARGKVVSEETIAEAIKRIEALKGR